MSTEPSGLPQNPLRVMAWVWVLIVSVLCVVDHVRLSRSTEAQHLAIERAQVAELERRVAALEATVSTIEGQPARVSTVEFQEAERARNEQLTQFQASFANVIRAPDLAPLEEQLTHLAAEVWRLRHPLPAHLRADVHERGLGPGAVRQRDAPPPFTVLGTELRGSEEFLAVAPHDTHSLSEIRVLRTGETDGGWKLDAIEGRAAVFETAGRLQRVPIP